MMGYEDDDGDDFGLPSLSNMKRRTRRIAAQRGDSNGSLSSALNGAFEAGQSRRFSNSADIAIERPSLSYPMPKKSEGKILRPQYKDILKGTEAPTVLVVANGLQIPPTPFTSSITRLFHQMPRQRKSMP